MANARSFREGWLTSTKIDALRDDSAELFLFRLGLKADKNGVYHGEPDVIRAAVYPMQCSRRRLSDVARYRDKLAKAGLVRLWTASDGRPYVQILNFRQKTQHERALFPLPPGEPDDTGQESLGLEDPPPPADPPKKKQSKVKGEAAPRPTTPAPDSQEEWLQRLRAAWPHLDLGQELTKAHRNRSLQGKKLERYWFETHWLPACSEVVVLEPMQPKAATITEEEPEAWRAYLRDTYAEESWAESAQMREWHELPANWRQRIAREMPARRSA